MPEISGGNYQDRDLLKKLIALGGAAVLGLYQCGKDIEDAYAQFIGDNTECTAVIVGQELQETPTYATDSNGNPLAMDTHKPTDITVWDGNGIDVLNPGTPHYRVVLQEESSALNLFRGEMAFPDGRQLQFTYQSQTQELRVRCEKDF